MSWLDAAGRPARRARNALPLLMLGAAAAFAACTELPSGPEEPFAIEFNSLPFPAVVRGDTLRGPDGQVAPLSAIVYGLNGQPIATPALGFIIPGRGATLLDDGFVVGDSVVGPTGGVAIYARVGGLQSLPQTLFVIPAAPDSLVRVAAETLELSYDVLPAPDTSAALEVRAVTRTPDTEGGVTGVQHWPVQYTLVAGSDTIARGDTSLVWLVQPSSLVPATADTTDAQGRASLRVRVNAFSPAIDGLDSVVVYVSTPRHDAALPGGATLLTTRFTVRLRAN